MSIRSIVTNVFTAFAVLTVASSPASATTLLKFTLSGIATAPDVEYVSGELSTGDDGDAASTGDQTTAIDFVGPLAFLTDITNASMTLSGVLGVGPATLSPGFIAQATEGGTFSIYAGDNSLLLSGSLDDGAISGSDNFSAGSFFTTNTATFTGGSLLAYVAPSPAGFSIALVNILDFAGNMGLSLVPGCVVDCQLGDFTASATGLLDGIPKAGPGGHDIPEPATALLFMSGLLGSAFMKRKTA